MSLVGPLHKVINCASIDKNRWERWIILFACKGIIEAYQGIWRVYITRAPSSVIHFGKDHPRVCSLISRGGSVIKAIVWLIKPRPTNNLEQKENCYEAKIPILWGIITSDNKGIQIYSVHPGWQFCVWHTFPNFDGNVAAHQLIQMGDNFFGDTANIQRTLIPCVFPNYGAKTWVANFLWTPCHLTWYCHVKLSRVKLCHFFSLSSCHWICGTFALALCGDGTTVVTTTPG